jgi:hypothetical protein
MIFGFLLLDIILWAIFPLIILIALWKDKKFFAGLLTVGIVGGFIWTVGPTNVLSLITDRVWIGNALQYVLGYLLIGFVFSFVKWKSITMKTAKAFEEFIARFDFTKLVDNRDPLEHEVQVRREEAAKQWNSWHSAYSESNKYVQVLQIFPKKPVGWETKYVKKALTEYIISWSVYWPFYTVLLVIDDLIRHIADFLMKTFGNTFKRLADSSFNDIK